MKNIHHPVTARKQIINDPITELTWYSTAETNLLNANEVREKKNLIIAHTFPDL